MSDMQEGLMRLRQQIKSEAVMDSKMSESVIDRLMRERDALTDQIRQIQEECAHPLIARKTENDANTGNWDKGADSYWTNHECTLCHRKWQTDQDWQRKGNGQGLPKEKT